MMKHQSYLAKSTFLIVFVLTEMKTF